MWVEVVDLMVASVQVVLRGVVYLLHYTLLVADITAFGAAMARIPLAGSPLSKRIVMVNALAWPAFPLSQ